jgi:hypothetical protein
MLLHVGDGGQRGAELYFYLLNISDGPQKKKIYHLTKGDLRFFFSHVCAFEA